jgi:hypothetical protein
VGEVGRRVSADGNPGRAGSADLHPGATDENAPMRRAQSSEDGAPAKGNTGEQVAHAQWLTFQSRYEFREFCEHISTYGHRLVPYAIKYLRDWRMEKVGPTPRGHRGRLPSCDAETSKALVADQSGLEEERRTGRGWIGGNREVRVNRSAISWRRDFELRRRAHAADERWDRPAAHELAEKVRDQCET